MQSVADILEQAAERHGARPILGTRGRQGYDWTDYEQLRLLTARVRAALVAIGVGRGDRVGIVSANSVEWAAGCYATAGVGAIWVPMYSAQQIDEWAFIIRDCGAKVVFAGTDAWAEQLDSRRSELPSLERVVRLEAPADDARSWEAFLAEGRQPAPIVAIDGSQPAGYIYTSGTTGEPKGVVLSHSNLTSNTQAACIAVPLTTEDCSLSFLPWAHAFGQTAELHTLLTQGCRIAINDDISRLMDRLTEVRPTILIAVPRVLHRVHEGVLKQLQKRPALLSRLVERAVAANRAMREQHRANPWDRLALKLVDRLVFRAVRQKFGGRLRLAVSGSAALSTEVADFIYAMGVILCEGYGLTECSPIVTANTAWAARRGSVGRAVSGVRVSIDTARGNLDGQGEIVVHSPGVMLGYHGRAEETAQVLESSGVLRTGDLGHLDADGYLFITGRIKEQYKLENGKYVVPSPLEEALKVCPWVSQVMLYGANRPFNVALAVLDVPQLRRWAREQGHEVADFGADQRIHQLVREELKRLAMAFKQYERPQRILTVADDLTVDNGMLTPTLKLRRERVLQRYEERLQALY
jgi:long-chain acyl-CoA synthetase